MNAIQQKYWSNPKESVFAGRKHQWKIFGENEMKKRKWYSLIDKVWRHDNLEKAADLVIRNAGAAGVDRQSTKQFLVNKDIHLQEIIRLLREKRYEPKPVKTFEIPKDNNKVRSLGIPTVRDRIVQQSLRLVTEPIFENKFKDCSYGFRPNRNCHQAVAKVEAYINAGNLWAVEVDIENFFDSIDHELLIDQVADEISDGRILKLIRAFLTSGIMKEGKTIAKKEGTPQGGVISPLLGNIYLHPLDEALTEQGFNLVRYADDQVIMCKSEEEADRALSAFMSILEKLKLKANMSKTKKVKLSDEEGTEFLGFLITAKYKFPRDKSIKKFKDKVRARTRRIAPVSLKQLIQNLNPIIRGWGEYFRKGNSYKAFAKLDSWIRMRLRCFIEKHKSYNANKRISNNFFESNGLISLLTMRKLTLCNGATASESRMR